MTMATTNGATRAERAGSGGTTKITHLDDLLGGHPTALREIYEAGQSMAPSEVVGSWRGLVLAAEGGRDVAALVRPIFQALRGGSPVWQGKTFFADGTGINQWLGRRLLRMGVEADLSALDGAATLVLRYDLPQHRNPWPLRGLRDELRRIGDGIALGPVLFSAPFGGHPRAIAWFGLERES